MEYRILGRVEVLRGGSPLPISALRHRRLLAVLLVHADKVVPSETLIEDLWGYEPPASAPASLHVRVSELRALLRGSRTADTVGILTRGSGYQLVLGPDDLDARSFERLLSAGHSALRQGDNIGASNRLAEALAIWRGPALADMADEPFALAEIARLDALHVQALEDNLDVELALGRHAEVVAQLNVLVNEYPLHERFWCQLMLAQYRAGRQGDALTTYSRARDALAAELGIDPGPELQRMHAAVLAHDPSLSPPAPLTPAHEPPNNLPRRLTSFIGRDAERRHIAQLLTASRLVTLVGPGGVGKSRLALQVAHESPAPFLGGIWLVELATIDDPEAVIAAVAAAVGVREHPEHTLEELLIDRLRPHPAVLLLDNCEHVLDAAAALAVQLLESCPQLAILATSRERLGITGEVLESLHGLNVGLHDGGPSPSEAERLFSDRAKATLPDIDLRSDAATAVAKICRSLDGIPLAIELAAARVNALSVHQIAARLNDRFRLLDSGQRTADTRHRTLRAVVDWSYSLLSGAEARLFDAAAVFLGGFTLEAAEFVCADADIQADDVAGLLWRLVDKSLVVSEDASGSRRYRMLETLRAYGLERLHIRAELGKVRERHASYYLAFAEPAAAGLRSNQQPMWLDRLELDHENLRAALTWAVENGRPDTAVRLAGAVYAWWDLHGHYSEGSEWLRTALAMPGEVAPAVRARALMGLATLATIQGDFELGASACHEAATLSAGAVDPAGLAHAEQYLAMGCLFADDLDTAEDLLSESLAHAKLAADDWLEAWALIVQGALALARDDPTVTSIAATCEIVAQRAGDPECVAWARLIAATGQLFRDMRAPAAGQLRDALIGFQRLGALWGLSVTVHVTGLRAMAHGEPARALRLLNASEHLRKSVGATLQTYMANLLNTAVAAARTQLGDVAADAAWQHGANQSASAAVAEAFAELDEHR